MVKEPPAELKFAIFKNWLDTRLKMETHEPNVYPTILGGVLQGFWSPFLDLGAQKFGSCISIFGRVSGQFLKIANFFWHLKTGTFGKSARFQMALRAPKFKNELLKPRETPPKMVG